MDQCDSEHPFKRFSQTPDSPPELPDSQQLSSGSVEKTRHTNIHWFLGFCVGISFFVCMNLYTLLCVCYKDCVYLMSRSQTMQCQGLQRWLSWQCWQTVSQIWARCLSSPRGFRRLNNREKLFFFPPAKWWILIKNWTHVALYRGLMHLSSTLGRDRKSEVGKKRLVSYRVPDLAGSGGAVKSKLVFQINLYLTLYCCCTREHMHKKTPAHAAIKQPS